jgi:hypothetical protein
VKARNRRHLTFIRTLGVGLITLAVAWEIHAADTIVADNFNVVGAGTGFGLDTGINSGIGSGKTRLVGIAADGLHYIHTGGTRSLSCFDIDRNRLRIKEGGKPFRFTLSANGKAPFDFGPALRSDYASKTNRSIYDVRISMRNDATSDSRCSFGISTRDGEVTKLDFALQLYRAKPKDTFYTIRKRFDRGSIVGIASPDASGDVHEVMTTTARGSVGTMIDFIIRVSDAGAEGTEHYNSRIQVSLNNGKTWVYDSDIDKSLRNGFRFDSTARYFIFDQAPNASGMVFYDDFSVTMVSSPE